MSDPKERYRARSEEGQEPDVEGHIRVLRESPTPQDEGPVSETEESEVEGHRFRATEDPDVEGHRFRATEEGKPPA